MNKIMVGMSGGVDSAVSAYLLKRAGYDVTGVTLRLCHENEQDISDAQAIAKKVGVGHISADLSADFCRYVMDDFVSCYRNGGTPNPCIVCNKYIKFGKMLEFALDRGMEHIATGHYAVIEKNGSSYLLKKAKDKSKDQTYVLYTLTQGQLKHAVFPLGEMTKSEVRDIAEGQGFVNARKKDSQDICFVPDGDYTSFILKYTGEGFVKGQFVDVEGNVLGTHKGVEHYTIGQRKGLGIALGKPAFVCRKDVATGRVVLGDNSDLFSKELTAHKVNLIGIESIDTPMRVMAKVRYNQQEQSALAQSTADGGLRVVFDTPQRAICQGQSVVLYDGDYVIGGGIID